MYGTDDTQAVGVYTAIIRSGSHDAAVAAAAVTRISDDELHRELAARDDIDAGDVVTIALTAAVPRNVFDLVGAARLDRDQILAVLNGLAVQRWLDDLEHHLAVDGRIGWAVLDACCDHGTRRVHHLIISSDHPDIDVDVIKRSVAAICSYNGIVKRRNAVQRVLNHGYGATFDTALFTAVSGHAGRFGIDVTVDGGARRWLTEQVDNPDSSTTELNAALAHLCNEVAWEVADWLLDRWPSNTSGDPDVGATLEKAARVVGIDSGDGDGAAAATEARGLAESRDLHHHRELLDLLSKTCDSTADHVAGAFGAAAYRLARNTHLADPGLTELAAIAGAGNNVYRAPILAGLGEREQLPVPVIVAAEPWRQPENLAGLLRVAGDPAGAVAAMLAATAGVNAGVVIDAAAELGVLSVEEVAGALPVSTLTSPEMAETARRAKIRALALQRIVDAVGNDAQLVRFFDELDTTDLTVEGCCALLTCL